MDTTGREIVAYAITHIMGYVASAVLTGLILIPLLAQTNLIASAPTWQVISFMLFGVEQVVVFTAFIISRGPRRTIS